LKTRLPNRGFKVLVIFLSLLTSAVKSKFTDRDSLLEEAFLFVQREATERYIGESLILRCYNFEF
jgi:hypothetical protein